MDKSNEFLKQIQKCLNEQDLNSAKSLIKKCSNDPETLSLLSDTIPFLISEIGKLSEAEKILIVFAEECDPEEVLLLLIDGIRSNTNDESFLVLCQILLKTLLRLPEKRLNSLGWGLNAVHSHLAQIELPDNVNLNEDQEILMDGDPVVERISFLFSSLLPFYCDLISSCQSGSLERKIVVLKFVLQLLGKPLAYLNLKAGTTTSKARRISERIVGMIFELNFDIYAILDLDPCFDIGQVEDLALATLFYLVLSERVQAERLVKVYDNVYVFQSLLPLAALLIKHENQFIMHNGLSLTETVINLVSEDVLSYLLLDSEHHSSFSKALTQTIVYSQLETYRKRALKLYQRYLFLFDSRGRYLLVYNLMAVLNHTGIIGFTITQFKDMLVKEIDKEELSPYFSKSNLYNIFLRFCFLPNREESDLVELADQIVAALNLLRYLIIRDKDNRTGIWDYIKKLEVNYLEPLKKGLELSRAHYDLKIKDLKEESGEGDKRISEVSLTVAGETLSEMPTNEKIKFLYSALTTFDVIDNLICRINELIQIFE